MGDHRAVPRRGAHRHRRSPASGHWSSTRPTSSASSTTWPDVARARRRGERASRGPRRSEDLLAACWRRGSSMCSAPARTRTTTGSRTSPGRRRRTSSGRCCAACGPVTGRGRCVAGGPSVVLEYGTVSRELADGMLRLLAALGVMARLKMGRTAKSTVDTPGWSISGAEQIEAATGCWSLMNSTRSWTSLGEQSKRIAATGYRCDGKGTAWVRVVEVARRLGDLWCTRPRSSGTTRWSPRTGSSPTTASPRTHGRC